MKSTANGKTATRDGKTVAKGGKTVEKDGKSVEKDGKTVAKGGKSVEKEDKTGAKDVKTVAKDVKTVEKNVKTVAKDVKTVAKDGKTVEKDVKKEEESSFYDEEDNLKKLCDFLRSKEGPPVREAVEMDKRVYYLKGEKLVNFLVEPKKGTKWPKNLPKFNTRQEATAVCKDLCRLQFMHRSEKKGKGDLVVSRVRDFDEAGYFTWMYEGDKTFSHLMTTGLIGGFLFCTCFPIWPNFLKVFVWYLSVSLLIFIFFLVTIRALIFLFIWILGYDCWFLPNLFDESLSFVDSFKPVFSWGKTKDGQILYRIGVAIAFSSFCWWAVTQPSEFDGFVTAQGDFIKDLYAGTLLSDMSQKDKENIDKPKMTSLDDILKMSDSEDAEEVAALSEEEAAERLLEKLMGEEENIEEDEE